MDRPAVSAGFVGAGIGAVGAALPWGGARDPIALALAAVAFVGFAAVRYGLLDAERGLPVGALGGTALAAYAALAGSGEGALLAGAGGVAAALSAAVVGSSARERTETLVEATTVGIGGYLVLSLWALALLAVAGALGLGEGPLVRTLATQAATLVGGVTVAAFYLRATDRGREYVDLAVPDRRDAVAFVVGVVGLGVVLVGYNALVSALGIETAEHAIEETVAANPELLVVLVPSSFLFVGLGEELLYRNVVQKRLAESFPERSAVVLGSAVFAAVHLTAYLGGGGSAGAALVSVFSLSVVLGASYAYSESLLVPVALHGLYDAVTFAAIAFGF